MTPTQARNFLYEWARRREAGIGKILLLGGGVGAAGGLLFAGLMWNLSGELSLNEAEMPPFLLLFARLVGPGPFLFILSLAAFTGLGLFMAWLGWRKLDTHAQALLAEGHQPAETKPVYSFKDRAPGLIVVGFGLLLIVGLLFGLWWELNRGGP